MLIALSLVEPPGERMDATNHVANMREIFEHLMKSGSVLRLTFLALAIWSLTTFYAVWLLQKLWQQQGVVGLIRLFGDLHARLAAAGRLALTGGTLWRDAVAHVRRAVAGGRLCRTRVVRHRRRLVAALTLRRTWPWARVACVQQTFAGTFSRHGNSLASFGFRGRSR